MANHGVRVNCLCPGFAFTDLVKGWLDAVWEEASNAPKEFLANFPKTHEEARERFLK